MNTGREALLKATVRVVARDGMRGLTYRAVAREAGVTHGLVAHHFGSIDALVLAAFKEDARTRDAAETLSPGTGDIDSIGADLANIAESAGEEERYQYEMILEALRRPELIEDVRQIYRTFTDAVEHELRLAGAERSEPMSRVVFAALDGLLIQQLITGDSDATRSGVRRLQAMIRADIALTHLKAAIGSTD